jgi:ADP-ribose pyrophosphatase
MDIPPVLARRELHRNRFFTFVEEDLPDRHGRPYTYYQVESKWDAVVVVPLLDDGRLVVERIYRHPYRAWLHEFPAGGIEPGEDPLAAAARELGEETGYSARALRLLGRHEAMPGLLRMRLHLVLATGLAAQAVERAHEAMEMLVVEEIARERAWELAEQEGPVSAFLTLGLLYLERWRAGLGGRPDGGAGDGIG